MVVLRFLYDLFIGAMSVGMHVAALFNEKTRKGIGGRRNWRTLLRVSLLAEKKPTVWVHAASLGEFEQGRPVIEAIRAQFPDWRIVLTFFSPSGFEIRKNYAQADLVCYLPLDTRRNAFDFLEIIRPDVAIFVKYEFWANYLFELKKRGIPTLLVSALFREKQPFFQWYGAFWRRMLACFSHFFVQNHFSEKLLQSIGFQNITVAGDTRVDRVLQLAAQAPENAVLKSFSKNNNKDTTYLLIAGSTWPADEAILLNVKRRPVADEVKFIFAPHDPSSTAVSRLKAMCPQDEFGVVFTYSEVGPANAGAATTLIIDNVGMLNTLYRYGRVAYIGGGFGKGIHNTLEPAAYGLPVIFGPKYEKFEEAREFVARGGAFVVRNAYELEAVLQQLQSPGFYENASRAVQAYLEENRGATDKILEFLRLESCKFL